jgi:hypothetical protein
LIAASEVLQGVRLEGDNERGQRERVPFAQELSDDGLVSAMDPVIVSYGGNTPSVVLADIEKSTDQLHDAPVMPNPDLFLR